MPTPPRHLDTADLPAAEAARAVEAVRAARFFERPARVEVALPRPWDFHFQLTVEDDDGQRHTVLLHRRADPDLDALLELLESLVAGGDAP